MADLIGGLSPTVMTEEIETGMRLLGARNVKELRPEMVELLDGLVGKQMS